MPQPDTFEPWLTYAPTPDQLRWIKLSRRLPGQLRKLASRLIGRRFEAGWPDRFDIEMDGMRFRCHHRDNVTER